MHAMACRCLHPQPYAPAYGVRRCRLCLRPCVAIDWAPVESRAHRWARQLVGAVAVGVFTFVLLVFLFMVVTMLMEWRHVTA